MSFQVKLNQMLLSKLRSLLSTTSANSFNLRPLQTDKVRLASYVSEFLWRWQSKRSRKHTVQAYVDINRINHVSCYRICAQNSHNTAALYYCLISVCLQGFTNQGLSIYLYSTHLYTEMGNYVLSWFVCRGRGVGCWCRAALKDYLLLRVHRPDRLEIFFVKAH